MHQLKYPEWQAPYDAALLEFDIEKLLYRVSAAETAIFLRLQALPMSSLADDERQAIAGASNALLNILRDVLDFPGFKQAQPTESQAKSALP